MPRKRTPEPARRPQPPPATGARRWVVAVLFLGTALLYAPGVGYPFINFDDPQYVFTNPHVLSGLTWENVAWAWTTGTESNWHPLTWLSLQLDTAVYGGSAAWGYRTTNVLLHASNAALLYWVLAGYTAAAWRSAAVAAVWAAHPLRVESVVWVTERKDVLSTLFWLLTMAAYLRYTRRPGPRTYLPIAGCLALGLMCKPMLVTLPFVLLLLDGWPLGRIGRRRLVVEKLPLLGIVAASVVVTLRVQEAGGAVKGLAHYPGEQRLATAVLAYARYPLDTLWPDGLAPFYPYRRLSLLAPEVLAAGLGLLAVTAGCVAKARSAPYLLVGWLWYLGTAVPVIGLVQVGGQSRADRYTYVPGIGWLLAGVWGVSALLTRWNAPRPARVGVAAAVLAASVVLSTVQIGRWRDDITLWTHTLGVTGPDNPTVQQNLGIALDESGRPADALPHLQTGAAGDPDRAGPQLALAACLLHLGRDAEAIPPLEAVTRIDPAHPDAHRLLGGVLARSGREADALPHLLAVYADNPAAAHLALGWGLLAGLHVPAARAEFAQAVELAPGRPECQMALGVAFVYEGRPADAEGPLRAAARGDPRNAQALTLLGLILSAGGRHAEAAAAARTATELDGGSAVFRANLGLALAAAGDAGGASRAYAEATRRDPGWAAKGLQFASGVVARRAAGVGLFLPECQARQACEAADYRDARAGLGLAAVLAAGGRHADAVGVLERVRPAADPGLVGAIDADLGRYRQGRP